MLKTPKVKKMVSILLESSLYLDMPLLERLALVRHLCSNHELS